MHMVPDAAGTEQLPTTPGYNRRGTGIQPRPPLGVEPGPAVLGGPHEVDPKREIGFGHDAEIGMPGTYAIAEDPRIRTRSLRNGAKFFRRAVCFPPMASPHVAPEHESHP